MKMKINRKATWAVDVQKVLERLLEDDENVIPKIPQDVFDAKDWKGQTQLLRKMLPDVLKAAKVTTARSLCCPIHNDENPSVAYRSLSLGFHCYVCAKKSNHVWDIFELIGILFNVPNFGQQRKLAIQMFVGNTSSINKEGIVLPSQGVEDPALNVSHVTLCQKSWPAYYSDPLCREFVNSRGISAESAMQFGLRRKWVRSTGDRYLVIPCENCFEVYRRYLRVDGNTKDDYKYPYNPDHIAELKPTLFNAQCLAVCEEGAMVFVVESAIDAILLSQSGFHALALNGVDNWVLLLARHDELRQKRIRCFLLLDRDEAGREREKDLLNGLRCQCVIALSLQDLEYGIGGHIQDSGFKDVGENYVDDRSRTIEALLQIEKWVRDHN